MDVSLRGVRKTYRGGITALDRLDLDIPPGMFGVLGPNGAGKTTLMRILAGVSRPDRGSVRAGGWALTRPRERRQFQERLGYLPRDLGLYPELTGRRFLDYAGTLKGMSSPRRRHRRVDAVLHLAGLDEVADRPAGGYSGGMRRRLGVAQALLNDPAVLLLDEPTAGLDPEERTRVRMLLASLAGQRTVVLATRDAADVSSTCRRCAVLAGGRVIFQGEVAGLARAARGRGLSIANAANGVIVLADRGREAAQAAGVIAVLLASRLAIPAAPASLGDQASIDAAIASLHAAGASRLAIGPCVIGPENDPDELAAVCAATGAQRAQALSAHPAISQLVAMRYGAALADRRLAG